MEKYIKRADINPVANSQKNIYEFIKCDTKIKNNYKEAYSFICGQFTEHIRSRLEVHENYNMTRLT